MIGRLFLALVMICGLQISSAWAYIPPSLFIVKSMATKHSGVKGVRVRTQVKAIEDGRPVDGISFKSVTAYDPQKNVLRGWAFDSENQVLFMVERRGNELNMANQLLFQANPGETTQALITGGVPIVSEQELLALPDEDQRQRAETTSLKRWQGSIAWVIGQPDGPQLWVEKGSFLPLRLVANSNELRFEGFHLYRGFPYPRSLLLAETSGEVRLREDLIDFNTGPVTGDFKGEIVSGMTEAGRSSPSQLRKILEDYYKNVR
ncbi:MAG: hypothetical protein A2X94_09955 [Bdellovibrionales bacterium GWB1_55_8]|nr:MAG: hypothetical protein A2X94_09955 [Bdellovibrionales bacterium GWB1_55_8]